MIFKKLAITSATQAVEIILAERVKIMTAIAVAESEIEGAREAKRLALLELGSVEASKATEENPTPPDLTSCRSAEQREIVAGARLQGLMSRLEGTNGNLFSVKGEMETAYGEYVASEMERSMVEFRKATDAFLSSLWQTSSVAESLGMDYLSQALRSIRVPDIEHYGFVPLTEKHWSASGDSGAMAAAARYAPVVNAWRRISQECVKVEDAAREKLEAEAVRSQLETLEKRRAVTGGMLGQVQMSADARMYV